MKFWDSSAIVPLILEERSSPEIVELALKDQDLWVWWGTLLECRTAIARRFREEKLSITDRQMALDNLNELALNWQEIQPSNLVREIASRLVSTHSLRAADSLQLASAVLASNEKIRLDQFLTFDARLARAAAIEGYQVPFGLD